VSVERPQSASSRVATWLVAALVAGWAIVYNVMRFTGSSPRQAAAVALVVGSALGLLGCAAAALAARRMAASGRVLRRGPVEVPPPDRLTTDQRDAMRLAAPVLAALAVAAILLGVALGAEYLTAEASERSLTVLLLAGWNVLAGLWIGDEALRLNRGEAEGVDSVTLGCILTAVLAGVGFSRSLIEPGQVVLIVLAGLGGAAAALVTWRLGGARGLPVAAIAAVLIALAALVLPLAA
jgi:hypothetical protein